MLVHFCVRLRRAQVWLYIMHTFMYFVVRTHHLSLMFNNVSKPRSQNVIHARACVHKHARTCLHVSRKHACVFETVRPVPFGRCILSQSQRLTMYIVYRMMSHVTILPSQLFAIQHELDMCRYMDKLDFTNYNVAVIRFDSQATRAITDRI